MPVNRTYTTTGQEHSTRHRLFLATGIGRGRFPREDHVVGQRALIGDS